MSKFAFPCAALFAGLLLSGCAMEMGGGASSAVSVTRFHLGQPIARGQIAVESGDPADTNSLEFAQVAASVERELGRLGWTVDKGNGRTEQVALISVDQALRASSRGRSGVSIGLGVGGGSWGRRGGVGVGVGGSVPVGGARAGQVVATQLRVRIQRRSDATVAWEGRAESEARAGSERASRSAAADRLAWALFRDFPGESGRTIRVR
jgi:hypothetical protein